MSRTKTTTIRVKVPTKRELLMQEIMRTSPGLEAMPTHAALAALARNTGSSKFVGTAQHGEITALPAALAQFERREAAITADPAIAIAARAADPGAWSTAQRLLGESREALTSSPARAASLAEKGDCALRAALESGARALAIEERTLATSLMDNALRSIGCRTTVAEGTDAAGIWAERGHQLVAVLIGDGGEVKLDVAGFDGVECAPFHEEIERAVTAHGGAFEHVEVVEHGDAGGGVLIRSAARAAGPGRDMARAIAQQSKPRPQARFARGQEQGQLPAAQRMTNRSRN